MWSEPLALPPACLTEPVTGFGASIIFVFTDDLENAHRFYADTLGLAMTTDQGVCRIYRIVGEAFMGVCEHRQPSPDGTIITLVSDDVVGWYERILARGGQVDGPPVHSSRFGITHFFMRGPDGYRIEIQSFDDPRWAGAPQTDPA